jgi:hypothetical protein
MVVVCAALALAAVAGEQAQDGKQPESAPQQAAAGPTSKDSALPAGIAGDWFWGTVSPTRYRDRNTGDLLGHGYSGALSYVFEPDGTYKRYFYLETRVIDETSSLFSASEGTVTFTGDTFTLKPTKGTYRFIDGPRKKPREREMRQDELERPGLVFTWRLDRPEKDGPPVLMVGKEGEEPRAFKRGQE